MYQGQPGQYNSYGYHFTLLLYQGPLFNNNVYGAAMVLVVVLVGGWRTRQQAELWLEGQGYLIKEVSYKEVVLDIIHLLYFLFTCKNNLFVFLWLKRRWTPTSIDHMLYILKLKISCQSIRIIMLCYGLHVCFINQIVDNMLYAYCN